MYASMQEMTYITAGHYVVVSLPGDSLAKCCDMAPSLYSFINSSIELELVGVEDWEGVEGNGAMGV